MEGEGGGTASADFLLAPERVIIDHRLKIVGLGLSSSMMGDDDKVRRARGRVDELASWVEIELRTEARASMSRVTGETILNDDTTSLETRGVVG